MMATTREPRLTLNAKPYHGYRISVPAIIRSDRDKCNSPK